MLLDPLISGYQTNCITYRIISVMCLKAYFSNILFRTHSTVGPRQDSPDSDRDITEAENITKKQQRGGKH